MEHQSQKRPTTLSTRAECIHDSLALKTSTFSIQNHENTFANMSLPDLDSIANIMIIQ